MNIYRVFFEDKKKGRKIDLNYACKKPIQIIEALNPAALSDWQGILLVKQNVTEAAIREMKSPCMVIPNVSATEEFARLRKYYPPVIVNL